MAATRVYTGRVIRIRHMDNPRRRRLLVSGQIQPDHRLRHYRFETDEDPRFPFRNQDRIAFELDPGGKPVNIKRIADR